jgi:hypothetical protein
MHLRNVTLETALFEDPIGGKHIRVEARAEGVIIEVTLLPGEDNDAQSATAVALMHDLPEIALAMFAAADAAEDAQ